MIGDPVDGRFFIAKTTNGGKTWIELAAAERPVADSGEAFFASSGTNLRYLYNHSLILASGGKNSRGKPDLSHREQNGLGSRLRLGNRENPVYVGRLACRGD